MKALILLGRLQPESENKLVTSICSQMINQMLPSRSVYIHLNSGRWHNNWCIGVLLLVSFSRSIFLLQELRQMWKIQTFVVCNPAAPPRFLFFILHFARYLTQHSVRQLTGRVFMLQESREMDVVRSRPKSVRLPLRARFVSLRSGMRRSRVTSTGILQEIKRHLTFGFSRSNSAMPFRIILHLHTH